MSWQAKLNIYKNLGVEDQLIITKESAVLSNKVNEEIKKIKM
jgi:hypothetical protein